MKTKMENKLKLSSKLQNISKWQHRTLNHVFLSRPYLIDLEATNGTFINGEQAPATRFIELKQKDMLKFGNSTREYILLCAE